MTRRGIRLADGVEDDLEVLRVAEVDLQRTTRQYLGEWLAEGYLARRIAATGTEEV